MRLAPEVSVRALPATGEDAPPRCEVQLHGRALGTELGGHLLEAAVEADGRFLLFVSNDCPYEELLHLHLLDAQGQLLDSATLGGPYTTGRFAGPRLLDARRVGFAFFDDKDWEVELLDAPRLRLPVFTEPLGVWRARPLRCHFIVHARPRTLAST